MKISSTQNQQLADEIQSIIACKSLILRAEKSISDRLLAKLPSRLPNPASIRR
jgi:hypothetical protein